jgi:MFS family permease
VNSTFEEETPSGGRPKKLMNRNFFLLWQGQLVSQIGISIFGIATMFWIKHATGSASLMGLLMMVGALPLVFLGPIGGTYADRYSRRLIIILGDVLRGIAILGFTSLVFLDPDATEIIIGTLFVVSVFNGSVTAFFNPAITAAIPDIVPRVKTSAANSFNQFSVQLAVFVGMGLGGTLFRILGMPILALINGLTFLFSAGSESFITIPQEIQNKKNGWKETIREQKNDLIEGLFYIWKKTGMRFMLFGFAILNFFAWPIIVLLPFYVEDFLNARPDWYGFLIATFGLGAMIGYALAGSIKFSAKARSYLMIAILVIQPVLIGVLGLVFVPLVSLLFMLVIGIMNGFLNINIITIMQLTTPSEIRGRVFGTMGAITGGLSPLAMGLGGVVADLTGHNIPLIYLSCGGITTAVSVILSFNRDFRHFLAQE